MNVLGHTHVALAHDDDSLYLLGAVLPDLAGMARVHVERARLAGPVARGVRAHVRADAVFHAHPLFRRGFIGIRDDLVDGEVRRGPARAVGHAGWELLLDGTLVGSPVEEAFHRAIGEGEQATAAIAPADRRRWLGFLARWRKLPLPRLRYDDPAWVADRLHAMLAVRPRLSFPQAQLPTIRRVLAAHAPSVADGAADILASVARSTERG